MSLGAFRVMLIGLLVAPISFAEKESTRIDSGFSNCEGYLSSLAELKKHIELDERFGFLEKTRFFRHQADRIIYSRIAPVLKDILSRKPLLISLTEREKVSQLKNKLASLDPDNSKLIPALNYAKNLISKIEKAPSSLELLRNSQMHNKGAKAFDSQFRSRLSVVSGNGAEDLKKGFLPLDVQADFIDNRWPEIINGHKHGEKKPEFGSQSDVLVAKYVYRGTDYRFAYRKVKNAGNRGTGYELIYVNSREGFYKEAEGLLRHL
ncbi:MAG: hypothetical protein KA116_09355 [Proteobacteria bacterium]|jgi:hypothetical protein|nr:hypothetical protein [Pseudomonadota bacterium]